MKVILMSGIPGSGKSTYIRRMMANDSDSNYFICSADFYFQKNFYGKYDPESEYKFNSSKLGEAHASCLKNYIEAITNNKCDYLVVDNTNTTALELSPYVAIASAYNLPTEIVTVNCDPHLATDRNVHSVSYLTCTQMAANLRNRVFPPYWNVKYTFVDGEDFQ